MKTPNVDFHGGPMIVVSDPRESVCFAENSVAIGSDLTTTEPNEIAIGNAKNQIHFFVDGRITMNGRELEDGGEVYAAMREVLARMLEP